MIQDGDVTYGNRVGRIDDKMAERKSESGAGSLDGDASRSPAIGVSCQSRKQLE